MNVLAVGLDARWSTTKWSKQGLLFIQALCMADHVMPAKGEVVVHWLELLFHRAESLCVHWLFRLGGRACKLFFYLRCYLQRYPCCLVVLYEETFSILGCGSFLWRSRIFFTDRMRLRYNNVHLAHCIDEEGIVFANSLYVRLNGCRWA